MREIKFRGKRLDNGEWIYGMPTYDFEYIFNGEQLDSIDNYEVTPETIGQFTGLKDKNGVEIYEWDIVLVNGVISANIVWANQSFVLKKKSDFMEVERIYSFRNELEVIGNIHDKHKQKQALIDMMRGDEKIGLYDDNPKNHGYER